MGINRFLAVEHANEDFRIPRRLYAILESLIAKGPTGEEYQLRMDGVDADWFDDNGQRVVDDGYFEQAPLYVIEADLPVRLPCELHAEASPLRDEHPGRWLEVHILPRHSSPIAADLFGNLYQGEARSISFHAHRLPSFAARELMRVFSFNDVPSASAGQLGAVLARLGGIEGVGVYDVGQGSCAAGLADNGEARAYFDMGCGVFRNVATVPAALTAVCLPPDAPVVLSHWDADHWALAHRFLTQRDDALARDWIAPRQKVGPTHIAFARRIRARGRLLLWPRRLPSIARGGCLVEKCQGVGRNESGLAVTVTRNAQAVLFPGDAGYASIPSAASTTLAAVVVPHHGGLTVPSHTPPCPGRGTERALYSYGPGNSYRHPLQTVESDHDAAGWLHKCLSGPPDLTRRTAVRAASGLGHIGYFFGRTPVTPLASPCQTCSYRGSLPGRCRMDIQTT